MYCQHCKKKRKTEEVSIGLGFMEIIQTKCLHCGRQITLRFVETGQLYLSPEGAKVEKYKKKETKNAKL